MFLDNLLTRAGVSVNHVFDFVIELYPFSIKKIVILGNDIVQINLKIFRYIKCKRYYVATVHNLCIT